MSGRTLISGFVLAAGVSGCAGARSSSTAVESSAELLRQPSSALLEGTAVAIAYSGFRDGQHPDRGSGAVLPTRGQIEEDLRILVQHGFSLIRLYDSNENSRDVLEVIRDVGLPVRVVLGAWIHAEVSSHETCAWVDEPVPQRKLEANRLLNVKEVQKVIELANAFSEIVVAVNVGNEALVTWNDHLVDISSMVSYLSRVKAGIEQPITTADNYLAWVEHGAALREVVDFAFIHTYPVWEGKSIDEGLSFTVDNLRLVQQAMPDTPMAIGEAGWTSVASEFGPRATEKKQQRYVLELVELAKSHNITTFIFEAFDESWKGNPSDPLGAEKHWGLFTIDRKPKLILKGGGPLSKTP